jgi:superfamily II DNA/RNA helicase
LKISEVLKTAATHLQFQTMAPIQSQVIPATIENPTCNIFAQAKTGAGKTLAFMLPILRNLLQPSLKNAC